MTTPRIVMVVEVVRARYCRQRGGEAGPTGWLQVRLDSGYSVAGSDTPKMRFKR